MVMERENNDPESRRRSGSFSRTSSISSSLRRRSLSISNSIYHMEDDDVASEAVSEAGDIGDRVIRRSSGRNNRVSIDSGDEIGSVVLVPENIVLNNDHEKQDHEEDIPWLFEYISYLLHLAVFGILGVLTRYLLQKLFGPDVVGATSDRSYMYLDLPSNMVGSFLMGWVGVVFKGDISKFSENLAVGLSTGYLGSLTTFSGWNQKMLDLTVQGQWVFALLGFIVGLSLAGFSIIAGIDTANLFKSYLKSPNKLSNSKPINKLTKFAIMLVQLLILVLLWTISGVFLVREFCNGGSLAQLWLGCLVGPFGVWIRWFLARLNGRGLGKSGLFKWIPFGTLLANVSAACIMAALATIKKAVDTKDCTTIASGIQLGFLGCLSTVSTFMAEFNAMRVSLYAWRAYVYALITIFMSFAMGTLIYSVAVWVKNYD